MPGVDHTINDEGLELQKHRVWAHVEERLDKRTARSRAYIGLVAGLLGIIGIPSLYFALQSNVVETVKRDISRETQIISDRVAKTNANLQLKMSTLDAQLVESRKLSEEADSLATKLKVANTDADTLTDKLGGQNDEAERLLADLNSRKESADQMMARLQESIDKAQDLSARLEKTERDAARKLASLAGYSERLNALQRRVQENLPSGGGETVEPSATVELSQPDYDAIRIRQEVSTLGQKGSRTQRLLTYSVFVKESETNKDSQEILNTIDKVIYKLNPKWFSKSEYVRNNLDDNFQFTVTVWGVTKVDVEIYIRGGDKIVRTALMSLSEPKTF